MRINVKTDQLMKKRTEKEVCGCWFEEEEVERFKVSVKEKINE